VSLARAGPLALDSVDAEWWGVCGNGRPTLTLDEFPALLIGCDEAAGTGEAKDAAEALGVNARSRLSNESPPEEEGGTARMVGLCDCEDTTSSSTSRPFASSSNSGGGEDGAVLPWENLKVDGVKEDATRVSSSDMLVEAECLKPFLRDRIGCGVRARLASNFAMVLATWLPLETRDPGRSKP
jgi:hypothetical protein